MADLLFGWRLFYIVLLFSSTLGDVLKIDPDPFLGISTPSRHVENNSDRKVSSSGTTYTLSFEDSSSFLQRYVAFQEV